MKKVKKRKLKIKFLIILLLVILVLFIGLFIFYKMLANKNVYYKVDSRVKIAEKTKIEDSNTVGWIRVQGTNIDYPIIEETDGAYYSGIDYIWRANVYVPNENRVAIYGHNILNVSSSPLINASGHKRFEPLMGFVYEDFAKENLYIQYTHDGKDYLYKIYAVSFLYANEENGKSINDSNEIEKYIKNARDNSIYDYDVDVNSDDNLISLITCTRYFGLNGKTTFRVDAREVRKNENIKSYSVEINQNYDIIKQDRR